MRALSLVLLAGCGLEPLTDGPAPSDDSGSTEPEDVMMIGDLQVSPGTIDFGDVLIDASASQEVTLTNTGSSTLSVSSAYLDGDTAYTLTALTPVDLAEGEDTTLVIDFFPSAEQTYAGTLNLLVSGEADFAVIDITGDGSLTGSSGSDDTGDTDDPGTASLAVSTDVISFGVVDIGTTATETVTITNTGTVDIMLQDVTSTAASVIQGDLNTPMLLDAGESTAFFVNYTPTAEVNTTAILTIVNDSGDEPEIAVTGEGYQSCVICTPVIAVSTGGSSDTAMDQFSSSFGFTDSQSLLIYNNGDVDLEIDSITLTNDTAAASGLICGTGGSYTLSGGASGTTIGAYGSTSVTVNYTFTGSGVCGEVSIYPLSYENTIVINSNDPYSPEYVITLGGNGVGF